VPATLSANLLGRGSVYLPMTTETKPTPIQLCPAQQRTFDQIKSVLPLFSILGVTGNPGTGKSTILRSLHEQTGGAWIAMRELLEVFRNRHPLALEEGFHEIVESALKKNDHVYLDDFSIFGDVVQGGCGTYPRANLIEAAFHTIAALAESNKKKLIIGSLYFPHSLQTKGYVAHIPMFEQDDYAFFCRTYLGPELAERLDFRKVHRFARNLAGYDLKTVGILLRGQQDLTTERYIDTLRSFGLTSNVQLTEVQQVTLAELKGVDDVIKSLETNVVVPLEQMELAEELHLRPKRGVLLVGPPGTGKTTVGRALAHRLKSKFFLIDGTYISGTANFYSSVHHVFQQAKHNAPAIIFVDDSDAIFESGEELGLYRYLLTMLDGLESESVGQVCVMMTAMDVGHLPPALIRSGRIELWLEMRLPDETARTEIVQRMLAPPFDAIDVGQIAAMTNGFTGADLKRLLDDGKNLYAFDRVDNKPLRPMTEYFLSAVETVKENKVKYAEAEARARQQRPSRPAFYDQPNMPVN
jgi:ATP-dependent 26S proteasome regulatory subunit